MIASPIELLWEHLFPAAISQDVSLVANVGSKTAASVSLKHSEITMLKYVHCEGASQSIMKTVSWGAVEGKLTSSCGT